MRTLLVALAIILPCAADELPTAKAAPDGQALLARFARLEGTWTGKSGDADVTITYKVTSGGSAVLETIQSACCGEMITVYHLDKGQLVLTHYCALGNQPHMAGRTGDADDVIVFECTEGSTLDAEKTMHMHAARFTLVDDGHLEAAWTLHQEGKAAAVHTFTLARAK